ncbi:MAG: response regulator transcription factor [Oscillospiraceae bacterium]|nr:response regulator transcription factor [Oscillospiraceae bacterium]
MKPTILIVEDEKPISDFLCAKLEASGYRVIPVFTGQEALSLAASHCPDLILLDLGLSDIDGMEVLGQLRGWTTLPVIIVSARQAEEEIVTALDRGANDYVTKPFSNSVLMARVRTALRPATSRLSDPARPVQFFDGGKLCIDHEKRLILLDNQPVHLTPAEHKILMLLAQNAGKVITYTALRKELWGPYAGDNRTLRVNMANLRRKIESNPADPRYILTEVGVGYRMIENGGDAAI